MKPIGRTYNREIFHGGDLAWAKSQYGSQGPNWIDLSTGINPYAYPVPKMNTDVWHRLPGAAQEQNLLDAARDYYQIGEDADLVAAPGTQALLQIIPYMKPNLRVAIFSPTYSEHAHCWKSAGHEIIEFSHLELVPDCADVVVIVSPNNPTGIFADSCLLRKIQKNISQKNGLLIIDEAFMDMTPERSFLTENSTKNTLILRSFGKFFGLAGIRLGFATGDPSLINHLKTRLGPWAVSSVAAHIGIQAFKDKMWVCQTIRNLAQTHKRLITLLERENLRTIGSTDLFVLVSSDTAGTLFQHLCKNRILVRPFPAQVEHLRFGLPKSKEEWARLTQALSSVPNPS